MMKIRNDEEAVKDILSHFERTGQNYFSKEDFIEKLKSGKQMRIKYGVDVTAPFLHLGHAVNLWMMRKLQDYGHKVIFLIGDMTTKIGDPTGKSDTRPIIPQDAIDRNALEFIAQIKLILKTEDSDVFEIRRNSEWFSNMSLEEFMTLLSMVTHKRLISRDMFQKRISEERDIYMHEMIYPILQGYDSKMLDSDLTIVGSDQLFNEMMGKFYQEKFNQNTQVIITTKITQGLDGKNKQSKSLNNYIALIDTPKDKFGKAMSMPDDQIIDWMLVYTDIPVNQIGEFKNQLMQRTNPRDIKLKLAFALVEKYHGKEAAIEEFTWFNNTISNKDFPDDAPELQLQQGKKSIIEILMRYDTQKSKTDLRRLLEQGGVRINGEKKINPNEIIELEHKQSYQVRVGKRRYFKITVL